MVRERVSEKKVLVYRRGQSADEAEVVTLDWHGGMVRVGDVVTLVFEGEELHVIVEETAA